MLRCIAAFGVFSVELNENQLQAWRRIDAACAP
jgi:hypothetical protein